MCVAWFFNHLRFSEVIIPVFPQRPSCHSLFEIATSPRKPNVSVWYFYWTYIRPSWSFVIDDICKKLIEKCAVWQKLVWPKRTPYFVKCTRTSQHNNLASGHHRSIAFSGVTEKHLFVHIVCISIVRCAIHAFFTNICVSEITAFVIFIISGRRKRRSVYHYPGMYTSDYYDSRSAFRVS